MWSRRIGVLVFLVALGALGPLGAQPSPFYPIDDVRPGMVGVGRTVFQGDAIEEFRAHIIGVLRNVVGPKRDLILARLEGGPLANTGVIQGMSGSPIYIDGRLVGAVSYALGSFPKEPIAGITPAAEMLDAVDSPAPRVVDRSLLLEWPASASAVYDTIGRVMSRAAGPSGHVTPSLQVVGPASLAAFTPALRPIGAAFTIAGLDANIDEPLRRALGSTPSLTQTASAQAVANPRATTLRPGDPVGMSLIRGDLQVGATGTVTHVDGSRVYAFGHPFLNLGSTTFPMTEARVFTVLPSLDISMKIATLGRVLGTMTQDRATAVGGVLGAAPQELEMRVALSSSRGPTRQFAFSVTRDQLLTPLFAYVGLLNTLTAYERQTGVLSLSARGTLSLGADGDIAIDDVFSGEGALTAFAASVMTPLATAMTNEFRTVTPLQLDLDIQAQERQTGTTIDRVWLDTTRPHFGETYQLQVQLQDYRGAKRVVSLPIAMPAMVEGPLTLLVSDAASLATLEQRELDPAKPSNWPELLAKMRTGRRNNRLYVRLLSTSRGTVVGGDTLPALPASVRSVLDNDATVARAPLTRTVVGQWEQRMDAAVRGSRELPITLTPR